jgi:hypothetical protein
MKRIIVVLLGVAVALAGTAAPATAHPVRHPWVPWPSAPFDLAAGDYCAFGVHADPTVDEVRTKTIEEYPDGSPKRQLATGALVFALTNTATGKTVSADAGGSAIFVFHPDGSSTWHVVGPVLAAFKAGASNIARGLWTIDGLYDIDFSPANFKQVTLYHGRLHDLCADLAP